MIDLLQLLGRNDRATWFPAAEFGLLQQRPFIQRAARQGFIKLLIFSHFSNVVDPSTGQIRIRTMGRSGFPPPSATVYRTIREDEFDYSVFCREWLQLGELIKNLAGKGKEWSFILITYPKKNSEVQGKPPSEVKAEPGLSEEEKFYSSPW